MGARTKIEWTAGQDGAMGATWNPVRGCSVTSPGCLKCYARSIAARFSGEGKPYNGFAYMDPDHGPQWTGKMAVVREHLTDPLRWRTPRRVFVNSMSDLFHEGLTDADIDCVFAVIAICALHERNHGHIFQILTKRSARMRDYMSAPIEELRIRLSVIAGHLMEYGDGWHEKIRFELPWPLPNVHLGVSVEDRKRARERVPDLLASPAAVRFLSVEPQLEVIVPTEHWRGLSWVVQGGESGHGARPFDLRWADIMRTGCRDLDIRYFMKQAGARVLDDERPIKLRSKKGNDLAELPERYRIREFPS